MCPKSKNFTSGSFLLLCRSCDNKVKSFSKFKVGARSVLEQKVQLLERDKREATIPLSAQKELGRFPKRSKTVDYLIKSIEKLKMVNTQEKATSHEKVRRRLMSHPDSDVDDVGGIKDLGQPLAEHSYATGQDTVVESKPAERLLKTLPLLLDD